MKAIRKQSPQSGAIRAPGPLGNPMLTFDLNGEIERLRNEDAWQGGWRTGATSFNKPFVPARETAFTRPLQIRFLSRKEKSCACFTWTRLDRNTHKTDDQSATFVELSAPNQGEIPRPQPCRNHHSRYPTQVELDSRDSKLLNCIWQSISRYRPAFPFIMITAVSSEGINDLLLQIAYTYRGR